MIPSIGRIVHYILPDGPSKGEHRPAIIVRVWGEPTEVSSVQLQVFADGCGTPGYNDGLPNVFCVTSVCQGTESGQWHEAEKV